MSNATLIIGPSGSGKSTSIRNLNHEETFIINVLNKPLPIKGYKKLYTPLKKDNAKEGNYFASDNYQDIIKCVQFVNSSREDIKTLIIDDWQYVLANEFMRRARETGFNKFTDISLHGWETINAINATREDLLCFVMSHSEIDSFGKSKCKTIGKMLDEKITVEGMFTIVLHSYVIDGEYKFMTQNDGNHIAKSPMGMFDDIMIGNDLSFVKKSIEDYYE